MGKKVVILSMSCNIDRYIKEEEVIRQTWGKSIIEGRYDNIELFFYRGSDSESYDDETKVITLNTSDEWRGTFMKTISVFEWLKRNSIEYDYVIRTNTSTYINIDAILQFLENEKNTNIMYGTGLVINGFSKFVPYLKGHFLIMPKSFIDILINCDEEAKSVVVDDAGFGIAFFKQFGINYVQSHILEVDSVLNMDEPYMDKLSTSFCVRIKDEKNVENNSIRMIGIHYLYENSIKTQIKPPHGFTNIDTYYGVIPINK
jgi:hypothetical protein